VIEKAVCGDLDPEELPASLDSQAMDGSDCRLVRSRRAERAEIVLTNDVIGRRTHRCEVEPAWDVMSIASEQSAALAPIEDRVDIGALARRKASRESWVYFCRLAYRAIRRQQSVERKRQPPELKCSIRCKRNHLTAGVNSAISAARARNFDVRLEQTRQRALNDTRDGAHRGLPLESTKLGAVVLES